VTNLPAIPPGGSRVWQHTANDDVLLVPVAYWNCNVKVTILNARALQCPTPMATG